MVLWFGLWTGVVLSHSSEPVHSSVTHQLTHVGELTQPYHPGLSVFQVETLQLLVHLLMCHESFDSSPSPDPLDASISFFSGFW